MQTEQRPKSWLTRLIEHLRKVRRGPGHYMLLCAPSGMTATLSYKDGSSTQTTIKWNEITRVIAFKRDLYTTDMICLLFETSEQLFEVNEQMEGWRTLTDALTTYLPGTRDKTDWWLEVVFPAFATQPTIVFTKTDTEPTPQASNHV